MIVEIGPPWLNSRSCHAEYAMKTTPTTVTTAATEAIGRTGDGGLGVGPD